MAILGDHFSAFHQTIALDQSRTERIQAAYRGLHEFLATDNPVASVLHEVFLQGSFANHTAVKPHRGEFDVDVVLALDATDRDSWFGSKKGPRQVIDWLATRLRATRYAGQVSVRKRCVRVAYAGEFHMDVVPAHSRTKTDGPVQVPDRGSEEWIRSHPKGYALWCQETNRRTGGAYTRLVKMFKWWRDIRFGEETAPSSILLGTLIGKHIPHSPASDAEAITATLRRMQQWLDGWGSLGGLLVPTVKNPSLLDEDLSEEWERNAFRIFRDRVRAAAEKAEKALGDPEPYRSARAWQEMFGEEFPA